jgi:hypothetical protein
MFKFSIFILFIIISCNINEGVNEIRNYNDTIPLDTSATIEKTDTFNVEYAGWGEDCWLPLIRFNDSDTTRISDLSGFHYWNVYNALNLEKKFYIKDSSISVILRKPKKDEIVACTMRGPSYPLIFIINAEWADENSR